MPMSSPRRHAPWLALCLVVPMVSGTAPGTFHAEPTDGCQEAPCPLWNAVHTGPQGKAVAHHMVLSHDGTTVYVVGSTSTLETFSDLVTWALDFGTGELVWASAYDGGSGESEIGFHDVSDITISPDGSRVVVAGTSQGKFGQGLDIVTVVYDAATGQELWVDRYHGGPQSDDDNAATVVVDRTSTYVVTAGGTDDRDGGRDGVLIGHELASGTKLWEQPFASACGDSDILDMKATATSAAVYVGGLLSGCLSDESQEAPQDVDLTFTPTVYAIEPATGTELWKAQDDDPLLTMQSAIFLGSLEVTQESAILSTRITNPRNPSADLDVLTMAVDFEGDILWRARYDSLGSDDLLGMRATFDGSRTYVFATSPAVTTTGESDQNTDLVVIAYDRGGEVVWTTRLDSSTTGLDLGGVMVGGESSDDAVLVNPALIESGTRLAFGYTTWFESPIPLIGPAGPNAHVVAVLDTSDGSVAAVRLDDARLRQYTFAGMPDRADFVAIGSFRDGSDSEATFRRLSLDVTPPELNLPGSLVHEATGAAGAVVAFAATATDDRDGEVGVQCSRPSGATFPLGTTVVECWAEDSYGNTAAGSFDVVVADSTPPMVHVSGDVQATATSKSGSTVEYNASAQDLVDGDVPVTCSHASGQVFAPGATQVTCRATDAHGNEASTQFEVTVTYEWAGFQAPLDAHGSSEFNHGRSVPVKVQLTGQSAGITDADFRLWVQTRDVEVPAVGRGTTANVLSYDEESGTYGFVWNTSTVPPGDHKLRLDLGDGTHNIVAVRVA